MHKTIGRWMENSRWAIPLWIVMGTGLTHYVVGLFHG